MKIQASEYVTVAIVLQSRCGIDLLYSIFIRDNNKHNERRKR